MTEINETPEVMEFFPSTQSLDQTEFFIERMQKQFAEKGYCYFAVDELDEGNFIGFIGLSYQDFESPFTPCIDIGWRLAQKEWNQGYATEGAKKCIDYAFTKLKNEKIVASCIPNNVNSERIMNKIGMTKKGVAAYRKANPGSKLQTAVTGKVKKGSKDAARRKSFCARMSGMKGPLKDKKGRPTRKAMALRRWRC